MTDNVNLDADGQAIPTHIMERMVAYSLKNQSYDQKKKLATEACKPMMDLFVKCTREQGMFSVIFGCRAENLAMNECMQARTRLADLAPPRNARAIHRRRHTARTPPAGGCRSRLVKCVSSVRITVQGGLRCPPPQCLLPRLSQA